MAVSGEKAGISLKGRIFARLAAVKNRAIRSNSSFRCAPFRYFRFYPLREGRPGSAPPYKQAPQTAAGRFFRAPFRFCAANRAKTPGGGLRRALPGPRIPAAALRALCLGAALLAAGPFPARAEQGAPPREETAGAAFLVYVTRTGKAYHRESCERLARSKLPLSLGQASSAGYTSCVLCAPPALSAQEAARERAAQPAPYRVHTEKLASYRDAALARTPRALVVRHVDGDTVELRFSEPLPAGLHPVEKVRLIGVDTPETVHPSKAVQYFGKEASDYTKNALLNKTVYVALDWDTRDKYGRLLAYLYTQKGICHNAELIKRGYGHAYTRFPFQFIEEFRALEREARAAKRGLWAKAAGP